MSAQGGLRRGEGRKEMRIGVKVGSSLLVKSIPWSYVINKPFARRLMMQLAFQINQGNEVFLVSSGAVASDKHESRSKALRAAVGQHKLMAMYQKYLWEDCRPHSEAAQLLLVADELTQNQAHIKKLIEEAFANGVLPIINANDAVNGDELDRLEQFEDNDQLFLAVCLMLKPEAAIIATDVDGVLDKDECLINLMDFRDFNYWYATIGQDYSTHRIGAGGMASKVRVGITLAENNIKSIIVNGQTDNFVERALDQIACSPSLGYKFGTSFAPWR